MAALDPRLRSACPLIRLAIPGSHDSMMYTMMDGSPVTPEAPEFLELLVKLVPGRVRDWVVTQAGDATEQLMHGIRYFDIRVCLQGDAFMLCHGVFSGLTTEPLKQIKAFLETHPLEVVVLDFQHVYRCSPEDHQRYCDELVGIFGDLVYPRKGNTLANCTLQEMAGERKQVILIYRDYWDADGLFWTGNDFRTPWPNTMSVAGLEEYLEVTVKQRSKSTGHVTQCVLTPDGKFILEKWVTNDEEDEGENRTRIKHFSLSLSLCLSSLTHNLKSACAMPVLQSMTQWIRTRRSGPDEWPGHNIFIADFVNLNEYQFVRAVLSLNGLLLLQQMSHNQTVMRSRDEKLKTGQQKWKLLCCGVCNKNI